MTILSSSGVIYGVLNWYANRRTAKHNAQVERRERILNHRLNPELNRALKKDQSWAGQQEEQIRRDVGVD